MANTIYWTPSIEKLQQANNTIKKISEASTRHGKIRLMRKCYSWASWGSPSQKTEILSIRLVSWARLVCVAENTDQGVLTVTDFRRDLRTISSSGVCNVFYSVLPTQSENSSPISLCHSLLFQSVTETDDNWPALAADISSNICSCVHLQTLAVYHVEASCVDLCLGPNLAFCFWLIWAVDWLFIKFLFQWWVCKCFLQNLRVSVWFVFHWALLSCAVLCCRRHKRQKCDSSAVAICAYSGN